MEMYPSKYCYLRAIIFFVYKTIYNFGQLIIDMKS